MERFIAFSHNNEMIPDPLLETSGSADSLTLEKALFSKRRFRWREGERELIARYSWDSDGRQTAEERDAESHLFAYDKKGRRTARYRLDSDGRVTEREIWEWDGKDRKTRRILRCAENPEEQEWIYEHDDSGRMTAERKDKKIRVEKRDGEGRIVREYLYDGENADLTTDYSYDSDGRLIEAVIKDPDGAIQRKTVYTWDQEGRPASLQVTDSRGKIIRDESYAYGAVHGKRWLERVTWIPDGGRKGKKRPREVIYRSFTFGSAETRADREPEEIRAYSNGVYRGPLLGDKPEGTGIFQYNDESRYEGDFRNGVMEGRGRLTWPDGRIMEGNFSGGLLEGDGFCVWEDGSRYGGRFRNGRMHGPGTFTWADGTQFEGLFENGTRTDQGVWERPDAKASASRAPNRTDTEG